MTSDKDETPVATPVVTSRIQEEDKPAILRAMEIARPIAEKIHALVANEPSLDGMLALLMVLSNLTVEKKAITPEFVVSALHDVMDVRDAWLEYSQEPRL